MAKKHNDALWATGRRKTSIAQVRLAPGGTGKALVNAKPVEEFFRGQPRHIHEALLPLMKAGQEKAFDVTVKVAGGGITGQAEAIRHGVARALALIDDATKKTMRKEGFLTRDSRMVERKKPGRPKARKRFQYSKR
ncbi:MAG TPA: 30S ribosomal protein S9 [Elusimicrobiota bacterium]|nr:30S ribosomal protein S9 [Elusimicrobiota bacterium]